MTGYTAPFLFDKLVGQLFLSILGNPLLVGIVLMFFFFVFGLALRLTLEIQIVNMFLLAMLVIAAYIPWLGLAVLIGVGILLGLFLFFTIFRG